MRPVLAAVAVAALLLPIAGGAAPSGPSLPDRLARDAAAAGIALPSVLRVLHVDLATGTAWTEPRALDAFLAEVEASLAPSPGLPAPRAAERVLGDANHGCYDPNRICYRFHTTALGSGQPVRLGDLQPVHEDLRRAYDGTPARDQLAFPSPGATALYVQGKYESGAHRAANPVLFTMPGNANAGVSLENGAPGSGVSHADRALFGGGVGKVTLATLEWGPGLFISFGTLRAHGAWTFCATETDPDCASP